MKESSIIALGITYLNQFMAQETMKKPNSFVLIEKLGFHILLIYQAFSR